MWLKLAEDNPDVEMWAYTKSLKYWINRLNDIPKNLILTASYGGKADDLIERFNLKNVKVYAELEEVPSNRPIDTNDSFARIPNVNFALLDNMKYSKNK